MFEEIMETLLELYYKMFSLLKIISKSVFYSKYVLLYRYTQNIIIFILKKNILYIF